MRLPFPFILPQTFIPPHQLSNPVILTTNHVAYSQQTVHSIGILTINIVINRKNLYLPILDNKL